MTDQEFISHKIGILIKEGYKKDQAAAISYSMLKDRHKMQKAQEGTYYQNNNIFGTQNPGQQFPQNMYVPQNQQGIMLDPNDMSQETYKPDAELRNRAQYNKWINSQTNNYDDNGNAIDTSNSYQDYMRLKIANPYTGIDPMARLYWSGMQFGQGNTGAGILGAVGGGLGLARTFMSGLGAGKENQRQEADMRYQLYGKQPNYEYGQTGNNATYVFQEGGTKTDSITHQANKILKYEQTRGGTGGSPLPYYSDPNYMKMLMEKIYPEVKKIIPKASAMEMGEAMDFIFNAGWDKNNNKITKDPRAYALQEYYRQYDKSKLDADGKWAGRKNAPYSFDEEYNNTVGKLSENQRRVLMNKGRDWYYKNTNNPSPGVPSSDYNDTWYGRIWNTNDYNEFNPNNPKFIPKKQEGGKITNAEALTGNYTTDMQNPNIEVERGEHIKNSQTGMITEAKGATHEDGGIKVNLPDNSKVLSDFTKIGTENAKKFQKQFDIAFKASHTFADVMDKVNNKIGLTKLIEEEKEYSEKVEKQLKSSIDEATKKVNLNFLSKEIEKLEKKKEMLKPIQDRVFEDIFKAQEAIPKRGDGYTLLKQEGGDVQNQQPSPEEIITAFSQLTGQDPQEIIAQLQQMQPEEQNQALQQMVVALQQGQQNPQEEQMEGQMSNPQEEQQEMPVAQQGKLTQAQKDGRFEDFYKQVSALGYEGKKQIGEMQTWMAKNYPEDVVNYFTKSGQPLTAKHVDIVKEKYKDAFQKAGIPSNKPSAQYTQEEKAKLKEALGEKADKNFLLEGFQDNKWDWRYPTVSYQKITPITNTNNIQAPLMQKAVAGEPITPEEQAQAEDQAKKSRMVEKTVMAQIPSNFILPPDSLRGVYKPSIDLSRLEPIKISPESNLAAIEGQRQAASDSLAFLPENQRAALMANMLGTTQASANQAIGATTQANTQTQYQTDVFNAGQSDKEQLMNTNLAKDYETKMLGAIRNTDVDLRRYYNQLNQENRQKFLDVSALNMLNQVTPNYQSNGADIFFNNAPLGVSIPQADPEVQRIFDATKDNPVLRAKYMTEYYKSKQS